jgi:hypothetical protein
VPSHKIVVLQWLSYLAAAGEGGNKGLLTMFARQLFPTCKSKERIH